MDRRSFVIGTTASASALWAGRIGAQDAYPSRSITVINPFPPGGVSDTITRPLDAALEVVLKQRSFSRTSPGRPARSVRNSSRQPSPTATPCSRISCRFPASRRWTSCSAAQPKFTNDDFIPLARIVADPIVMIINTDLPYKTLKELIEDAKANPNKLIFSSSGLYGASHVPTALLAKAAGNVQMRHLPTNGGGPAVTAVLGGNASFFMSPTSIAIPHIKGGKVRPLAVSSAVRAKSLPDVPTFKEQGYDLEYYFLGRPVCAQRHTRSRHRQAARGDQDGGAQQGISGHARQARPGARLYGPARIREILGRRRQENGRRDQFDRACARLGWRLVLPVLQLSAAFRSSTCCRDAGAGVPCGGRGRPWGDWSILRAADGLPRRWRPSKCAAEETMKSDRRTFLKTTGIVGGALLTGVAAKTASTPAAAQTGAARPARGAAKAMTFCTLRRGSRLRPGPQDRARHPRRRGRRAGLQGRRADDHHRRARRAGRHRRRSSGSPTRRDARRISLPRTRPSSARA